MKPSVGSNCVFRVFPGERERDAPLSPRRPRGCRGAERPTPAPSETKAVRRTACIVGNEYPHQNSSGRAREGRNPLAPRHPRGCRGAERPTPASSETKPSREQPAPSETNISTRTAPGERERVAPLSPPVTRGGVGEQSAPRPRRRKQSHQENSLPRRKRISPPEQLRESARGSQPSRTPSGVRKRSAPRPRRRKQCPQKDNLHRRKPIFPPEQPRRAREGVNPLDFQSRPATCAAERLLAQRASKSLRDRPSEIEDFGWSPRVLIFSQGACPPEKKSLPCRFRARKSAGFQRNLRKGGAEGNPSHPPPGVLERVATSRTSNQNDFRRKSYPFPRGWQWRGSLLPRPPRATRVYTIIVRIIGFRRIVS